MCQLGPGKSARRGGTARSQRALTPQGQGPTTASSTASCISHFPSVGTNTALKMFLESGHVSPLCHHQGLGHQSCSAGLLPLPPTLPLFLPLTPSSKHFTFSLLKSNSGNPHTDSYDNFLFHLEEMPQGWEEGSRRRGDRWIDRYTHTHTHTYIYIHTHTHTHKYIVYAQ